MEKVATSFTDGAILRPMMLEHTKTNASTANTMFNGLSRADPVLEASFFTTTASTGLAIIPRWMSSHRSSSMAYTR